MLFVHTIIASRNFKGMFLVIFLFAFAKATFSGANYMMMRIGQLLILGAHFAFAHDAPELSSEVFIAKKF
jgi:hypothetical protein